MLLWFRQHQDYCREQGIRLEALYAFVGLSRQAIHQFSVREQAHAKQAALLLSAARQIRVDHPQMGARLVYLKLRQDPQNATLLAGVGRDAFEDLLLSNGLRVRQIRNHRRTTHSGLTRSGNLIEGLIINELDHVWMSDITYFDLPQHFGYLTIIMDAYSRRCLACQPSLRMTAELTVIPALKKAIATRGVKRFDKLIFHSDAGGQYQDNVFLKLLDDSNIKPSNALDCYENPFIERLNGIIKNDYLYPWGVNSFRELQAKVEKSAIMYNFERPHSNLKYMTPTQFEQYCHNTEVAQRPTLTIKIVDRTQKTPADNSSWLK